MLQRGEHLRCEAPDEMPQIEFEKSVDSPKAVLRSSHFAATVMVADVGVADCSKALALKARF
jgi:hypothetical protein